MRHDRLVAFGCSLTYGQGLKDCYRGKNNKYSCHPSVHAWPSVLGKLLTLECLNLSKPGSSNKRICHTVLNTDLNSRDLVVVLWSYWNRYCAFNKNRVIDFGPWRKNKENTRFFTLFDDNDLKIDSNDRIKLARLYLNSNSITNYHLIVETSNFYLDEVNRNFVLLEPSMKKIRKKYPKALDNQHPNEESHKEFAEMLHSQIKDQI